jgi:ribonuclease R
MARRGRSRGAARGEKESRVVWPPESRETGRSAVEQLMRERGLARRFDAALEREAQRHRDRGLDVRDDLEHRRDLRHMPTFTIDPASARDFDDAISAERLSEQRVRVWVHIADVSAYVPEGSPLDLEARSRATSVYVPGTVEPMLPAALSNDVCSLVPGEERLAVTVELDLEDAQVLRTSFYRSLIRSDARLVYEDVDDVLAGTREAEEPWSAPLAAASGAARALAAARERAGGLVLDALELEFELDDAGNVGTIHVREQTQAHGLIEHLMIAANEAVARLLQQRKAPCLYRVHERPDPGSVERLVTQLASLEVPTPPLPDPLSPSQASELLGAVSKLIDAHVRRSGHGRRAFTALTLRSLKQAYYSPNNIGHAGLGSGAYCHFTSPIRRYPDLVCHRALLAAIGAGERPPRSHELAELGAWTSERERDAMLIERDADDVARGFALERELYERGFEQEFPGEIVGLIGAGAFVAFGAAPEGGTVHGADAGAREAARVGAAGIYEGMLPARTLTGPAGEREWWELNELGTLLRGERSGATLRLGDPVRVRVARVDASRGRVDVDLCAEEGEPSG